MAEYSTGPRRWERCQTGQLLPLFLSLYGHYSHSLLHIQNQNICFLHHLSVSMLDSAKPSIAFVPKLVGGHNKDQILEIVSFYMFSNINPDTRCKIFSAIHPVVGRWCNTSSSCFSRSLRFVSGVNFHHLMDQLTHRAICAKTWYISLRWNGEKETRRVTGGSDSHGGIKRWGWVDDSGDSGHNELIKRLRRMKCQSGLELERWREELSGNSWSRGDSRLSVLSLESQLFLPRQQQQSLLINALSLLSSC